MNASAPARQTTVVHLFDRTPDDRERCSLFAASESVRAGAPPIGLHHLTCLVYMGRSFGYFPPVRIRLPSAALYLLKQARAFGLVLCWQHKILHLTTRPCHPYWFHWALQTERDKAVSVRPVRAAPASANSTPVMAQTLAALGNLVFLMNNVHDDGPEKKKKKEVFEPPLGSLVSPGPLHVRQITI